MPRGLPTIRFQVLYVFLYWPTTADAFCISLSPIIRQRNGRHSNSEKPSRGTPRDAISFTTAIAFGQSFVDQVKAMGIKQVLSAPRSPWQRAYIERVIGTIPRECLDHMIVLNQRDLVCDLRAFLNYYHRSRTHLSLEKDAPEPRRVQSRDLGSVISIPELGGLHHRYERRAA